MGVAILLLNLAVIVAAALIRYDDFSLRFYGPIQLSRAGWWAVAGVSGAMAVGLMAAFGRGVWRDRARRIAALESLIVPALWGYVWLRLPARGRDYSVVDWVVLAAVAAFVLWRIICGRRDGEELGLTWRKFSAACRLLVVPTVLVSVGLIAYAVVAHRVELRWGRLALAVFTYPIYALPQLLVLMLFLVTRLRRMGASVAETVVVGAGMFALAHWPNGVLMIACAVGAAFWTWVYLSRPNLYALALSMGVTAGTFTAVVPSEVSDHMRTGPMHVYRRVRAAQRAAAQPAPERPNTEERQ